MSRLLDVLSEAIVEAKALEAKLAAAQTPAPAPTPVPAPTPAPTPIPAPTAFPDASNTGPKGTLTSSGSVTLSTPGQILENKFITGNVTVNADNCIIRNCLINSAAFWAINNPRNKGLIVEDCEIDGKGKTTNDIYGQGTFRRNDIHHCENPICTWGSSANKTLIQDNYIHDMLMSSGAPHYDGIEVNGGTDIAILHNTVICDHDQTSAVMLDNYFGPLARITVDNNHLSGGGYTVYCDGQFSGGAVDSGSIKITNNKLGKGQWGHINTNKTSPVLSGNVDATTGAPV